MNGERMILSILNLKTTSQCDINIKLKREITQGIINENNVKNICEYFQRKEVGDVTIATSSENKMVCSLLEKVINNIEAPCIFVKDANILTIKEMRKNIRDDTVIIYENEDYRKENLNEILKEKDYIARKWTSKDCFPTTNNIKIIENMYNDEEKKIYFDYSNLIGLRARNLVDIQTYNKIYERLYYYFDASRKKEDELNKFMTAYKLVGENVKYAFNVDGEAERENVYHSIVGAVMLNKATCEGYAEMLGTLLNMLKIENINVTGQNKYKGWNEPKHVWNQVKVNGIWYNCDITNDAVNIQQKRKMESCLINNKEMYLYDIISKNYHVCTENLKNEITNER